MHQGPFKFEARFTIHRQQQGAVQINEFGPLGDQKGGGHAQGCRQHTADHDFHTRRFCLCPQVQGLCQATGLIQLDVNDIIFADQRRQPFAGMGAFIRT